MTDFCLDLKHAITSTSIQWIKLSPCSSSVYFSRLSVLFKFTPQYELRFTVTLTCQGYLNDWNNTV